MTSMLRVGLGFWLEFTKWFVKPLEDDCTVERLPKSKQIRMLYIWYTGQACIESIDHR